MTQLIFYEVCANTISRPCYQFKVNDEISSHIKEMNHKKDQTSKPVNQ